MCVVDSPDVSEVKEPDPVVTDEDQNAGGRAVAERDAQKAAAMYGSRSMRVTSATGLPGGAQTAGKKATGA